MRTAIAGLGSFQAADGRPIELRPAHLDDVDLLFEWQQHPEMRHYSRNSAAPDYDEHCSWLVRFLDDPDRRLEVITHGGEPAGALQLSLLSIEISEDERWEVSIYVAPDKYRLSIGAAALAMARALLPNAELVADIHPDNHASLALFRKCSYVRRGNVYVNAPAIVTTASKA